MKQRFKGQTVIITGASSGVGAACARLFSREGANIVLVARNKARLTEVARELKTPTLVQSADVSKPGTFERIFRNAEKAFDNIHILVNNAGVNVRGNLESISTDHITDIVRLNLLTPLLLSRMALPYLRKSGHGSIVNVASLAGRFPLPHEATYSATKFGLRAFSKAVAQELEGTGIKVSVVSPGPIATGFILTDPRSVPPLVFSQPMSTAEQVAALVLDSAFDGKPERVIPWSGGFLTTLAYLFPALRRVLEPVLERKGRKVRQRYIDQANANSR